ncbi:MAG TPA: serine/threonine-protein kinase [Streptosporangiaceae bacterium]
MSRPELVAPLRRWDPEQIGGYVLIGRLGAGAMGRVYLGRSAAGRLVAVKTIKIELADEPDFRTRFAQEVAAARRVSGAFTAAVVAADPEADVPWLATAYVPAPSLSTLVRACGPLPVSAVRWLAAGCAEALESIHSAGLVHRDLKPSNVLVSPDGPRVIDFGVARAAERIQLTVTRGAVGTPAYMAPEQARDTRNATTASDVFSLGATMLFGATGHAPYQGETVMDVLVRLATEPPDLTGLPPDLADIVTACLDRDPRRRPSSALVLARLAPAVSQDGPASLPGSALALIEEYHQDPKPSTPDGADGAEEATFGSLSADWGGPGREAMADRKGTAPREGEAGSRNWPLRQRRGLLTLISAAAAIILIAAGAGIGATVAGSRRPPPLGPLLPPPPQASALSAPSGKPQIGVSQIQGDSRTVFVVHGQGFPPRRPVTVALAGVRASPEHPVADDIGTFSYAINQAHEFFAGRLPLGTYEVVVTGPGGSRAVARFAVLRP